jgi:acyl-CoA synthetase (AMP-forming)/AMP-acid ligase II
VNIAGILHEAASTSRDRLAIVEPGRAISFGDLDHAVAAAAGQLRAAGVTAGVRVLVGVPMSIALYTVAIALFRLRATAVFVDPSSTPARLNGCIERVRPGAFVGVPRAHWLRLRSSALRAIPLKVAVGGWAPGAVRLFGGRTAGRDVEPCEQETPAIITFTSGSTGAPKAVVRTHGFLLAQHRALATSLALAPGDVDLSTLPIFVFANLASGVTSVIPDADLRAPGGVDPGPVAEQIRARRPTRTVASPAFLARLVAHATRSGQSLDSFRRVYTGGAPVFPGMLESIRRVATNASVAAVYGSTEAEPIAEVDCRDISADDLQSMMRGAGLLAGEVVSSIALRVLPDRWGTPVGPCAPEALEADALGPGAAGEIVVSGDHVLAGYLDGVGDEETKIRAGDRVWHRTGDAGYVDRQGRLWLLGRCSAKVSDARGVVYPLAVECAASTVPDLVRSAFVLHRGRRLLVVEVTGDTNQVRADLERQLDWAGIAQITLVPHIPVDGRHNAKVDYPALLQMLDRM